jgi:hypothetical protein
MTYIQSQRSEKNILKIVLAALICTALGGVFWLVTLYNNVVNLNHDITTAKAQLDSIGGQNTALNSQIAVAMGNVSTGDLATADGLVTDNHPTYFNQSWPIASQR